MQKSIDIIKTTRQNFLNLLETLSLEQLNKIPEGFNNNILWNFGHLVATQQILCNRLGNATFHVEEYLVKKYGKGTKPEGFITAEELDLLKKYVVSNIEDLEKDLENGVLDVYTAYTTSYNVQLETIADAIRFVAVHEGVHYGYAMALKRLVL